MFVDNFSEIRFKKGKVLVLNKSLNRLDSVKRLVFDCDGVIVDTRNSYDSSIIEVLSYISKPLTGEPLIDQGQIGRLKATGLYNNEWDTVYALTIFVFSQLSKESAKSVLSWLKFGKSIKKIEEIKKGSFQSSFGSFIERLKKDPIDDAEEYARSMCTSNETLNEFEQVIHELGSPLNPSKSLLVKLFDSIYYGNHMYRTVYGSEPLLKKKKGLIENEQVVVSKKSLENLGMKINLPFLMLTGRSRIGVEHVLNALAEYFDFNASIFIEDIVRYDNKKAIPMKKPSPLPLLNLAGNSMTLYVGDSAEDIMMANFAKKSSAEILFAGITGLKEDPESVEKFFMEYDADLIVKSVDELAELYTRKIHGDGR